MVRRHASIARLTLLALAVLLVGVLAYWGQQDAEVRVASAKGQTILRHMLRPDSAESLLRDVVLADSAIGAELAGQRFDFLGVTELGLSETAAYRDLGCTDNCAILSFYTYDSGGTLDVLVDRNSGRILSRQRDPGARPGASPFIVERVVEIAAGSRSVRSVLGDIRKAPVAMLPMSTWLSDDACSRDWCVDLSFHDPAGSGRIFHVVVNLHEGSVARTFYTRGRPDRVYQLPPGLDPNAPRYTDGCYDQAGWRVCWEMTAHDGLNLYDAAFGPTTVFTSAKIGQVEAYYPSWPGGYRDEIGYASSVPPAFNTRIDELEDGFAVRQMFTEAFGWPNCICCYRYEQVITFKDDGSFVPEFISYGPGCDDLSEYRPFWRFELHLGQADSAESDPPPSGATPAAGTLTPAPVVDRGGDQVWFWQETQWVRADSELELAAYRDYSLEGARLATFDGDIHYKWEPVPTDPLLLDEGRLFVVRDRPGEGNQTIVSGAADTFDPPRGYVDGESLADGDVVIWYVPILKTKKGGPWWCMPDPEPAFNPCNALMRVVRDTELRQPSAEELAQRAPTPTPMTPPGAPDAPGPRPTPRPIEGQSAEAIISNAGCGACHSIGDLGEAGKVGPSLTNIAIVAGLRVPGQPAREYLYNSILYPNLYVATECPNGPCMANVMPGDYYLRLSEEQVNVVVDYLLTLAHADDNAAATPILSIGDDARPITAPGATAGDSAESPASNPTDSNRGAVIGLLAAAAVVAALGLLAARAARRPAPADGAVDGGGDSAESAPTTTPPENENAGDNP